MPNDATTEVHRGALPRGFGDRGALRTVLQSVIVLTDRRDATLQDQIDAASVAGELGHNEAARLLYQVAFINAGFSRSRMRMQKAIIDRSDLWPDEPIPQDQDAPKSEFMLDIALSELRNLIRVARSDLNTSAPSEYATTIANTVAPSHAKLAGPIDSQRVASAVADLWNALRFGNMERLDASLTWVRSEILTQQGRDIADHVGGSTMELAACVALNRLRDLFVRNYDLCWPPFGSAAIFATSAKQEDAALGPYCTSVNRLLRDIRDLFGLVALALDAKRGGTTDPIQRWIVLLSSHLDHDTRVLVVDEIGDRGWTLALRGMLDATRRLPDGDGRLLWTIRDAAIDNAEWAVATDAQSAIANLPGSKLIEWIILAEICGSAGLLDQAQIALDKALELDPSDEIALERVQAMQNGTFEIFHAAYGPSSPPWRVALRAQNRREAVSS